MAMVLQNTPRWKRNRQPRDLRRCRQDHKARSATYLLLGSGPRLRRSRGRAGCERSFLRAVLEGVIDDSAEIDQHAQGLARRIFSVKHDLPRLTDHAQTRGWLLGGKLRASAIDSVNPAAFQFAQAILNGVEVVMHQAEEEAPDHEAETNKGRHRGGIEEAVPCLGFEFAALFKSSAVQKVTEPAAAGSRLPEGFKRSEPGGKLERRLLLSEHGREHLRDKFKIDIGLVEIRGCTERKILHQQEIDFVSVRGRFHRLPQVMDEQIAEYGFVGQRRGLQKLAQLMDLNLGVNLLEPCFSLSCRPFDRAGRGIRPEGTGGYFDDKFADQRLVDRMEGLEHRPRHFRRRL